VKLLAARCPDMKELDVSDATKLSDIAVRHICAQLYTLEHLSVSRCYHIHPQAYLDLLG